MNSRQWFVFTFGAGQFNEGKFVKVYGTYSEARQKMVNKYDREWAFQYTLEEWTDWLAKKPKWLPVETLLEEIK